MAAGELASAATMNVTGNQTASMLAGMLAGGVTAQGLNGIDGKFNISGNKRESIAVEAAKGWQGSGRYPGVDDWKPKIYQEGDILYRGEPNGSEFFTTYEAIDSVGANKNALFEGLQVEPHPTLGYRSEMQGYQFKGVIDGAESVCLANPDYGAGGLIQEFVPNANDLINRGILVPVNKIELH